MLTITEGLSGTISSIGDMANNMPREVDPVERANRVNFYLKMRDVFGKFPEPSNRPIGDADIKSMGNNLNNFQNTQSTGFGTTQQPAFGMSMQPTNSYNFGMQNNSSPIYQQHQQLNNQQQDPEQNNELTMV